MSVPPDGIASRALSTRFRTTRSICPGSARTAPLRPEHRDELDAVGQHGLEQAAHPLGHLVQVERLGLEHLAPAVGEKLTRELGGSLRADEHHLRVTDERTLQRQLPLQELGVAHDDDEAVVEVVGDAARELADGPELLLLAKLGLQTLPRSGQLSLLLDVREVDGEKLESTAARRATRKRPSGPSASRRRHGDHALLELEAVDLALRAIRAICARSGSTSSGWADSTHT